MPATPTQQRDSRRRVQKRYAEAVQPTKGALTHERHRVRLDAALSGLRENYPRWTELDLRQATLSVIMTAGFLAVYLIDLIILWPALEFLVSPVFNSRRLAVAAGFLLPAAVLTLETVFAAQRDEAREAAHDGDGWGSYWCWTGVATLFAVAMPAAVAATFLSARYSLPAAASNALLLMLLTLSLGGHVAILFGGRRTLDAVTDSVFLTRHRFIESKRNQAENRRSDATEASGERFGAYQQALEDHNRRYPDNPITPGEFTPRMQQIIEGALGRPAFRREAQSADGQSPAGEQSPVPATPTAAPSPAPEPQPEPAAGENEYLRNVLNRRIRDDESEVKD